MLGQEKTALFLSSTYIHTHYTDIEQAASIWLYILTLTLLRILEKNCEI